jgi:uncharacterized protein
MNERNPNRLLHEKSPYLLQHAYNPVDWYTWSDEAFNKAKQEDKPVFLSIGYSTCHWCHVMEKESFEDEEVAALMNDAFISIKVDREERPEIDGIYMAVCQMLTGSGGWPLTVVLTPDKKPFFAGTYYPKHSKYGRMGMVELIPRIKEIWRTRRSEVLSSAEEITSALNKSSSITEKGTLRRDLYEAAFNDLNKRFDRTYGGFNVAPKFPTPHNFLFLLRYWKQTKLSSALEMVSKTLMYMRRGGIYDQVGFGFHRYSTDPKWLVPHFEKMLYDQALLVPAYLEAFQATGEILFKKTAEEILEYVLRDMTSPEGGFYSAEDADSEGVEGKFYLWKREEIEQILDKDASIFIKAFNISIEGNWSDPLHDGETGTNIPYLEKSYKEIAEENNLTENEVKDKLEDCRKKLFYYREQRIHPLKDTKILTDWNGLMISAFAKAAQVLHAKKYEDAAVKCAEFILKNLVTEKDRLLHRYKDGESGLPAHIEDYSFFIAALLDLYETTFNSSYIIKAIELNKIFLHHFWDKENGGFFFTADDSEELIVRQKDIYDGALPSGNSIALSNLLRLARLTSDIAYEDKAKELIEIFSAAINSSPASFTQTLTAIDFILHPSFEIIIAGEKKSAESLIERIHKSYIPSKVVLFIDEEEKNILEAAPFLKDYSPVNGKPAVYVCKNYNCNMPVTSVEELENILK